MSSKKGTKGAVVFDTNVIEGQYLTPLLRGEQIRDFAMLRDAGYMPAVVHRSILEILQHAKQGRGKRGKLPWMDSTFGYPGGIEEGQRLMGGFGNGNSVYWWFGRCEEWQDFDQLRCRVAQHVCSGEQPEAIRQLEAMEKFKAWKEALKGFCRRLYRLLEEEMTVLLPTILLPTARDDMENPKVVDTLLLELVYDTMIPSEDLEILACSAYGGAKVFVTEDADILEQTALSLSLNHRMAFVHPQNLSKAMSDELWLRWGPEQSRRQTPPVDNRSTGLHKRGLRAPARRTWNLLTLNAGFRSHITAGPPSPAAQCRPF